MKRLLNKLLGRVYYIEEFPWPIQFAPFNTFKFLYERNYTLRRASKQLNIPITTATQRRNK